MWNHTGDVVGVSAVTRHITTKGFLRKACMTTKKKQHDKVDPLHLSERGYRALAEAVANTPLQGRNSGGRP
jgi:lysophospholipase L1-like esterase